MIPGDKYLYIVRHGECEGNADPTKRGPDSPLTEKGIAQAKEVADRLDRTPVEIILASPMPRAYDTARIISEKTGKEVVTVEEAHEARNPSALNNNANTSRREFEQIFKEIFFEGNGEDAGDGERFSEIKARAEIVLQKALDRPERNIVLVSHGRFLRAVLGIVLFGDSFNSKDFYNLFHTTRVFNTGITLFEYFDKYHIDGKPRWRLAAWNDHAHLG